MTQIQQPEALRLAAICETKGIFPVADELNRMHARILELEQGKCLQQIAEPAEPAEPSATYGMHFGDRVLHIGGRENAAGYIEFGSVEAVRVLVGQVLRDLPGGAPGFELAATQPAAQTTEQAPVAWRYMTPTGWHSTTDAAAANRVRAHHHLEPLYAATQPAAQGLEQDAERWGEVLRHVGAAPHFGGQHFTLNTLQAPDSALGFKANLMSGSVAQHFTKAIDAERAAQVKQGGA